MNKIYRKYNKRIDTLPATDFTGMKKYIKKLKKPFYWYNWVVMIEYDGKRIAYNTARTYVEAKQIFETPGNVMDRKRFNYFLNNRPNTYNERIEECLRG